MFQSTRHCEGEFSKVYRLQEVIQRTAFHHLDGEIGFVFTGEKDHSDGVIFLLDGFQKSGSWYMWHPEIQYAYIRPESVDHIQSSSRVRNSLDQIAMNDQQVPDERNYFDFVVDYQNS